MPSINFTSGIIRTPFAPGSVLSKQPRGGTFIGPLSLLNIFLSVVTRTVDNCETPCMRSGELSLSFVTATRCHCKSPILQLMKFSKCTDDYLWKLKVIRDSAQVIPAVVGDTRTLGPVRGERLARNVSCLRHSGKGLGSLG